MEYTTIDITQSDIDKSLSQRIGFYKPCPIQDKLRVMFTCENIIVNGIHILCGGEFEVNDEVKNFIVNSHHGREVKPFSFQLIPVKK
jgi:hypothetical protein